MATTSQPPEQDTTHLIHDDAGTMDEYPHLVIPGQVIASTNTESNEILLRGHGTYLPEGESTDSDTILRASVTGTVQRVNQLITVESVSLRGGVRLAVGDLVVGRITNVLTTARWTVCLDETSGLSASLPLSGVALPDQQQRIRTAADAWEMRSYLQPGDMVAAEVHRIQGSHRIMLHARTGHGKLHAGCGVAVPSRLVVRRKTHVVQVCGFQVLLGCNGWIWLQQQQSPTTATTKQSAADIDTTTTTEATTTITTPMMSPTERQELARLYNAVVCLRETRLPITPEALEAVVQASRDNNTLRVSQMVWPEHTIALTASLRHGG